jgi:hypothetical protein
VVKRLGFSEGAWPRLLSVFESLDVLEDDFVVDVMFLVLLAALCVVDATVFFGMYFVFAFIETIFDL